jgi:hypothetical protein
MRPSTILKEKFTNLRNGTKREKSELKGDKKKLTPF